MRFNLVLNMAWITIRKRPDKKAASLFCCRVLVNILTIIMWTSGRLWWWWQCDIALALHATIKKSTSAQEWRNLIPFPFFFPAHAGLSFNFFIYTISCRICQADHVVSPCTFHKINRLFFLSHKILAKVDANMKIFIFFLLDRVKKISFLSQAWDSLVHREIIFKMKINFWRILHGNEQLMRFLGLALHPIYNKNYFMFIVDER